MQKVENVLKEYISNKSYVSRSHAKIVSEGENLYITNLSGTNFTYVNNEKIANDILKFKNLLDIGAITQEEYDAKKKEILRL